MKAKRPLSYSELQAHWYERLKNETDFVEIENTTSPDRPLLEWHSFKFTSEKSRLQRHKQEAYQQRMDSFANSAEFREIIGLMVKHGNSKFGQDEVTLIWELHRASHTERGIANQMGCSQSCIHFMIKRLQSWMNLT